MEAIISALIPAIVESVFGALTEAVGLSDWLRQRLGRDPEKLAFHQALTQALTDSATHYPGPNLRYFAEILRGIGGPLLARTLQPAAPLPTAHELTTVWLNHLTVDSLIHYRSEFTQFATHFLDRLQFHLENQQPLRWIVQARHERSSEEAIRRMADAAEQSAINVEALRQEIARLTAALTNVLQTGSGSTVTTGGGSYNAGTISAQNFAGRDLTINQYFVQGLARLVFNYSARIDNFLFEYLGGQGQRVPFGGRQAQMHQLNTWLDDSDAAPYLLMVAEAGGGKSALVTRWSAQLTTRTDWEVIFVPISIRFQTAAQDVAFAALAARLAQIYEQQSTLPAALSAEQWKGQCETYLRLPLPAGKRLLVVIDGLDEATGWEAGPELFAKRPPVGLRILVTARVRAKETDVDRWATRLGWQDEQIANKLYLPGLDRRGIEEALVSMGNPLDHLATQVDLVSELHRLSQGDPLVVRLYVEALQAMGAAVARLRPEDLTGLEPRLDGFMERWWDDQRKQWRMQGKDPFVEEERLLPLLHACTVACGPLLLNDLAELDKQHFGKGLLVTHMAELLGRWVIGDGRKQGYVFGHPRLRNYFSDRMTLDEEREWQAKFCGWGERVLTALNAVTLDPKQAPDYLLRYYSIHLEQSHAPAEAFYALISNGWWRAWEELDISYSGFLGDVDRVRQCINANYDRAKTGKAVVLIQQVKAALCKASIVAIGDKIPPHSLVQAVQAGLRTPVQALAIAKLASTDKKRADMLSTLIPNLPAPLLDEALAVARSTKHVPSRFISLYSFIPYLPTEQGERIVSEALTVARLIEHECPRSEALGRLVPYLFMEQRQVVLSEALAVARSIDHEYYHARLLSGLAPHLPVEERQVVLSEALTAARSIDDPSLRIEALVYPIPHLSPGQIQEALDEMLIAARSITKNLFSCVKTLSRLTSHLSGKQRQMVLDEALTMARSIDYMSSRAEALGYLIPYLTSEEQSGVVSEVLAAAYLLKDEASRVKVLSFLAPYLSEEQRQAVLGEILIVARSIEDISSRDIMMVNLAPYLPTTMLGEALTVARSIQDEFWRAWMIGNLASRFPVEQYQAVLGEALTVARSIHPESNRTWILDELTHSSLTIVKHLLTVSLPDSL